VGRPAKEEKPNLNSLELSLACWLERNRRIGLDYRWEHQSQMAKNLILAGGEMFFAFN